MDYTGRTAGLIMSMNLYVRNKNKSIIHCHWNQAYLFLQEYFQLEANIMLNKQIIFSSWALP